MTERPGSAFARELFDSNLSEAVIERWVNFDSRYDEAIRVFSSQSKRTKGLVELDRYIWNELPAAIKARTPIYMIHEELASFMRWKLTRGKFRPLQKLVESNSPASVVDTSTLCFASLQAGNWIKAISALSELRGIGVATASGICALLAPETCPFMADEAMEAVGMNRDYTDKTYGVMRERLIAKANELGNGWTAERVGRTLWTCAILSTVGQSANEVENVVSSSSKKGAKKSSGEPVPAERKGRKRKMGSDVDNN